jgi:uncharacterized protein YkuJ
MEMATTAFTNDLPHILARLYAMTQASDSVVQTRRFDAFGIEAVKVDYNQATQIWTLHERRQSRSFAFDDLDLVAIEIYDVLHDLKLTF